MALKISSQRLKMHEKKKNPGVSDSGSENKRRMSDMHEMNTGSQRDRNLFEKKRGREKRG